MKTLRSILIVALIIAAISCEKTIDTPPISNPPIVLNPVIQSISPDSGTVNTVVFIYGSNFSDTVALNTVKFNGVPASILSAVNNKLIVLAPNSTTGEITVTVNNITVQGPAFRYLARQVSTVAGTGVNGYLDGPAASSQFSYPMDIVIDSRGNLIVSEQHWIRKISPSGDVTRLSGHPFGGFRDGPGDSALFRSCLGLTIDQFDNVYVADKENFRIRKIAPDGQTTTFAGTDRGYLDGPLAIAKFDLIYSVACDRQGNFYVTESNRIRKISANGIVSTLAGSETFGYQNGPGSTARFSLSVEMSDIAVNDNGIVFVTDNDRVRQIMPDGTVSTFAGSGARNYSNGVGVNADFNRPWGLCFNPVNGNMLVVDAANAAIRQITPGAVVSSYAGTVGVHSFQDGPAAMAKFKNPKGVAVSPTGVVYIADHAGHRIRKIEN